MLTFTGVPQFEDVPLSPSRPSTSDESASYADGPCVPELVAVLLAGTAHILTELLLSEPIAFGVSAVLSVAFLGYLVWRVRRTPHVLRLWGMRRDNFAPALIAHLAFVALGAVVLLGYGFAIDSLNFPPTFLVTVALYPIWGVAQQFALQNLIVRNLTGWLSSPLALAVVAALLFGLSHYPRFELVTLTLVAGVSFTLIYRRFPNLWAVGIAHGILGSLAAYIVLGEDPGTVIIGWFVS